MVKQSEQTDCQVKPLPLSSMWWRRSSKGCVMLECVLYVSKLNCSCFMWYIPNDFHVFTDNESTFSLTPELVTVCCLAVCSIIVTRVWNSFTAWKSRALTAAGTDKPLSVIWHLAGNRCGNSSVQGFMWKVSLAQSYKEAADVSLLSTEHSAWWETLHFSPDGNKFDVKFYSSLNVTTWF